jgi:hypothetical protein
VVINAFFEAKGIIEKDRKIPERDVLRVEVKLLSLCNPHG